MAATPHKLVHWALDVSMSEFGSPLSEGSSTESILSTSTLHYINSQLVAHGFTTAPGLSLDGLSNSDTERVVKCLLGMLSQRVDDMSRAEELTTKFRTLSYDHDRLVTMHRTATEKAANAEREMNLHKSRLAATTRTLHSSETAHKHITAELQRVRTSLQALRLTHQSELKKKEKEIERMVDKWSKLADAQLKLGAGAASGLRVGPNANVGVVEVGPEVVLGKGMGYLEIALEQAEKARGELGEENGRLRRLVVGAVNDVQAVLHLARSLISETHEEPAPFTQTTLFPLHPPTAANDRLTILLASLRESLTVLSRMATERPAATAPPATAKPKTPDGEIERLQAIIDTLRVEIDGAHKQSATHAAETQALFDGLQQQPVIGRTRDRDAGEVSVDYMITPAKDEERDRIEGTKKGLDEERRKFTEAAVRLGREKAALEAERIRFLDEKRSWKVEQMLAELPPTPLPPSTEPNPSSSSSPARLKLSSIPEPVFRKSQRQNKSPRKSPVKPTVVVGKAGTGRRARVSRRSSLVERLVEPSFETEVMAVPPAFPVAKTTMSQSLLPTSFVLPPPSPDSSLPPCVPALLSSAAAVIPALKSAAAPVDNEPYPSSNAAPAPESSPEAPSPSPSTPPGLRRPFPMAKPYATRMVHAYSPARPSPLSRILMLNDDSMMSPPDSATSLEDLVEEEEHSPTTTAAGVFRKPPALNNRQANLGTDGNPLREKKVESNVNAKTHTVDPDAKRFTAKEKGKGKADLLPVAPTAKIRAAGNVEKENQLKVKSTRMMSSSSSGSVSSGAGSNTKMKASTASTDGKKAVKPMVKPVSATMSGSTRVGMKLPPGKGGARRVPIDSAEAAPVLGPGWKG